MPFSPTLIIGAGPAGLAMGGRLSYLGLPFETLEQSDRIAPVWHRHYERLQLHTVKRLSHLPHKPFEQKLPLYVAKQQLIAYFESYAKEFNINPIFGTQVRSLKRVGTQWVATDQHGTQYESNQVVVCTGFNRRPHLPGWPGMSTFAGEIIHSQDYRNAKSYKGKRVLVVGMGNTGAEIALDLCENGAQASLSVRGPVNIIRRDTLGRPVQETAILLSRLPAAVGDQIGKLTSKLTVGDLSSYGIERPDMAPAEQLRKTGKTPVIDIGTVDRIKAGDIGVFPAIKHFDGADIHFEDGRIEDFDAVILATGYRPALEEFMSATEGIYDENGYPSHWEIPSQPGLYMLGYDVYTPGGMLMSIRKDSELIAQAIKEHTI